MYLKKIFGSINKLSLILMKLNFPANNKSLSVFKLFLNSFGILIIKST